MVNAVSKKMTAVIISVAVVLLCAVVFADMKTSSTKSVSSTGFAMGSLISAVIYGTDDDAVITEIFDALNEEEAKYLSRYKESSEIFMLNSNGSYDLSDHTAGIIRKAVEISKNSNHAFDITVGRLSSLWNFDDDSHIIPAEDSINTFIADCGSEKITFSGNNVTLHKSQQLDAGAIGKGIGCDIALEILRKHTEITGAVISVGGTILTYGENPDGKNWTVGIRTPEKDDSSVYMTVNVKGTKFISTSGNYEKSFEKDGVTYHHILSPETGYPVNNSLKSVTIIADSGLEADALSTACYVLGINDSRKLTDIYSADAVFICDDYSVYTSDTVNLNIQGNYSSLHNYGGSYEEYSSD